MLTVKQIKSAVTIVLQAEEWLEGEWLEGEWLKRVADGKSPKVVLVTFLDLLNMSLWQCTSDLQDLHEKR